MTLSKDTKMDGLEALFFPVSQEDILLFWNLVVKLLGLQSQ